MTWQPVRLSPVEYVNEPGILKQLDEIIVEKHYKNPVILTDSVVIEAVSAYVPNHFF